MKEKVRKRVPVSCLNCKKRKVKCERGRPCAGCIKNNVPHLCVYLEPDWAQSSVKLADEDHSNTTSRDTDAVRSLEAKVAAQATELMCLRAQLDHAKKASANPPLKQELPSTPTSADIPLTVLTKLSTATKPESKVLKNGLYSMVGFKMPSFSSSATPIYTIYSWLNVIKLDPQLTALWFRVTNLQKSYHLYKTSLLRKDPQCGPMMQSSSDSSDSNSCGHHKCPVVACEFNLMLEESESSLKKPVPSPQKPPLSQSKSSGCSVDRIRNSTQSSDALELLRFLQNMWGKIIGSTTNSEPLSYSQLCFLISFYLDDFESPGITKESSLSNETESCHLFDFFKVDIISIFVKNMDNGSPYLNLAAFSTDMSDMEVIVFLRSKAVLMCMLALIVEESLDRLSDRQNLSNDVNFRLSASFPAGIPGRKFSVLSHVTETIQFLFQSSESLESPAEPGHCPNRLAPGLDGSLAIVVLLIANMNRNFTLYERQNTAIDCRTGFSFSFKKLLRLIKHEDRVLQIWCDPSAVVFGGNSSPNENASLGLLLTQIWCDFMRIINNAIFNLLPVLNYSIELHESLDYILNVVHVTEKAATHKQFLESVSAGVQKNELTGFSSRQIEDLSVSLKTNYLIVRCSILVRNSIALNENNAPTGPIFVSDFEALVGEMRELAENMSLTKLRMLRFFETKIVFYYLDFFLKLIMFLQFEEVEDTERISQMLPSLFATALDINKFLQGSQSRLAKGIYSNYVSAIIADLLARITHLISGVLLRFKVESKEDDRSSKSQFMSSFTSVNQSSSNTPNMLSYSMMRPNSSSWNSFETTVSLAEKEQVIKTTDETVLLLESLMPREHITNKTKIWKFYMTFIRNAHEINASNIARIHGEGFSTGKLLDKCPIMSGPSYEVSATRGSMKCPVLTAEAPNVPVRASGCPMGHKRALEQDKEEDGRYKKCPVTHVKLESPERADYGEPVDLRAGTPQMESLFGKKFTPPLFANPGPNVPVCPAMPFSDFRQKEDMDWDSLPNFNFDFIGEEGLMSQINAGDFNNPRIENMFQ